MPIDILASWMRWKELFGHFEAALEGLAMSLDKKSWFLSSEQNVCTPLHMLH